VRSFGRPGGRPEGTSQAIVAVSAGSPRFGRAVTYLRNGTGRAPVTTIAGLTVSSG